MIVKEFISFEIDRNREKMKPIKESSDTFKLSDNVDLALSCIPNKFIGHYSSSEIHDSIVIMEKNGYDFGRIYWFHDDNTIIYLYQLNVNEKSKRQGIGTELQQLREKMGLCLGAKISCLWVKKGSWMHDWYKRRGYIDWKNNDTEENAIWMKKINKNDQLHRLRL